MDLQRSMNRIFDGLIRNSVMVYLDDIIIFDKDIDEHKKHIEEVIRRLDRNNFKVNPTKIQFCQNEIKVLGMDAMKKKKWHWVKRNSRKRKPKMFERS